MEDSNIIKHISIATRYIRLLNIIVSKDGIPDGDKQRLIAQLLTLKTDLDLLVLKLDLHDKFGNIKYDQHGVLKPQYASE